MQLSMKPDKAKERPRTVSGSMSRAVSWNELHPEEEPLLKSTASSNLNKQPSGPVGRSLLHKLAHPQPHAAISKVAH